ncbi:hypothetical protein [Streptomyces macrosporus]|uniref:Uncharacterized protein n=1 Tax=Streptomyces macrosporus TaxID=44032 RepID=A0ABN3KE21_9ACTN
MKLPELSPEKENEIIEQMIREQGASDPASLADVTVLVAIGLTNGAWRNTRVENWHAGDGPLSDGDMLRINSATTYGTHQRLKGWLREYGLSRGNETAALDTLDADDLEELAVRLFRWLVRPSRTLANGMTLARLASEAGDTVETYADDAERALTGFLAGGEKRGVRYAFLRAAAHGAGACSHWWGHPNWPKLVDAFLEAVGDPRHEHWGAGGKRLKDLPPIPAELEDRGTVRVVLLKRPWKLGADTADWITWAGIRYLRSPATA